MGWASAGDIFDPVAQALIDLGASEEIKRRVLGELIERLQDGDWDTEGESLGRFRNDLVIVELFYARNVGGRIETTHPSHWFPEGRIQPSGDQDTWMLSCEGNRSCDEELAREPKTAAGHDALVRRWAAHDRDEHGGTGEVNELLLIQQRGSS